MVANIFENLIIINNNYNNNNIFTFLRGSNFFLDFLEIEKTFVNYKGANFVLHSIFYFNPIS